MVTIDDYSIVEHPNRLVIVLPQTEASLETTTAPIGRRKNKLSDEELAMLLCVVKAMFEETT